MLSMQGFMGSDEGPPSERLGDRESGDRAANGRDSYAEEAVKHVLLRMLNGQRRLPLHEVGQLRAGQFVHRHTRNLDPRRRVCAHGRVVMPAPVHAEPAPLRGETDMTAGSEQAEGADGTMRRGENEFARARLQNESTHVGRFDVPEGWRRGINFRPPRFRPSRCQRPPWC